MEIDTLGVSIDVMLMDAPKDRIQSATIVVEWTGVRNAVFLRNENDNVEQVVIKDGRREFRTPFRKAA